MLVFLKKYWEKPVKTIDPNIELTKLWMIQLKKNDKKKHGETKPLWFFFLIFYNYVFFKGGLRLY